MNVPAVPIRGFRVVPHSRRRGVDTFEKRVSPRGDVYFWNAWTPPADPDPETDAGALAEGWIALTPLRLDATDPDAAKVLRAWDLR
jgi:5'-nucleotidase